MHDLGPGEFALADDDRVGVLGDLGMHAVHVPLRLGWKPVSVYAQLQQVYTERPDGKGGVAPIDTWDNATLATWFDHQGKRTPMRIELKRFAPGETTERSVDFHMYMVTDDGDVRELASADRATLSRALYRAARVRDPRPGPLAEMLAAKEDELAVALRLVRDEERADGVRPAVWPMGAFVVG